MTGNQKLEHVALGVTDLDAALTYYTDVMGLTELRREGETVYLGCGFDDRFDLAVREGDTGVDRFAIRVDEAEDLDEYERRLTDRGVSVGRVGVDDPHHPRGIRFSLPSDVTMELVTVEDRRYNRRNETAVDRPSAAPDDLDHVTLMSTDVQADVAFLEEALDFRLTEVHRLDDDNWRFAWTRYGSQHHDVAIVRTDDPEYTLHHLAWKMSSMDHMKLFADRLAQFGHEIEVGISRHRVGSNLFAYFLEPGGNRFELSAEMPTLDDTTPTRYNEADDDTSSAWGGVAIPDGFGEGS